MTENDERYTKHTLARKLQDEGAIFKDTRYSGEQMEVNDVEGLNLASEEMVDAVGVLGEEEVIKVRHSNDSQFHDGGEIGLLVEIPRTGQLFLARGVHSSWDAPYWDEDFEEVEEKTRQVIEYYYEPVRD